MKGNGKSDHYPKPEGRSKVIKSVVQYKGAMEGEVTMSLRK